jgi:hypothetical protein
MKIKIALKIKAEPIRDELIQIKEKFIEFFQKLLKEFNLVDIVRIEGINSILESKDIDIRLKGKRILKDLQGYFWSLPKNEQQIFKEKYGENVYSWIKNHVIV